MNNWLLWAGLWLAVGVGAQEAQNLLSNSDFADGLRDWWVSEAPSFRAEVVPCELAGHPRALRYTIDSSPTDEIWACQSSAKLTAGIRQGERFALKLWARSPERCVLTVQVQLSREPWTGGVWLQQRLTPTWTEYLLQGTAHAAVPDDAAALQIQLGRNKGVVEIAGLRAMNLKDAPAAQIERPANPRGLVPFVLPWNDATGGVTNLADWNDKPAGAKGFVTVQDGHFAVGGRRLRFFGTNVCAGGAFVSHEIAAGHAARMAKFGYNIVRWHHLDAGWSRTIFQADKRTLDPEQMEKLDFYIAELKKHGIYSNLNLHVSRVYPGQPTWPGMPDFHKGVDLFHPPLIELQKEYARDLLHHVNRYTGRRYVDEPAVAMVEINNENGLLLCWHNGSLDAMPEVYRTELTRQWNNWLRARYANDAALRAAWDVRDTPLGAELLRNGNFAGGGEGWYLEQNGTARGRVEPVGGPAARLTIGQTGAEGWHAQFMQTGLKVAAGQVYTLTFRARAERPRTITVDLRQAHEPWRTFWQTSARLTEQWRTFSLIATATEADDNARVTFGDLGRQLGWLELADVSLRPGGGYRLREGEALGSSPMVTRAESTGLPPGLQRDWIRFLWNTEEVYWTGLYRYLKEDLQVKVPVFGTAAGFSPPAIQARLDAVDSHAYWHHPRFLGAAWDAGNWEVDNTPMTDAANGGNIGGLASYRVVGKPFLVTEYNAPAPQTRNAEAFLLLAAYAAFQDWDALFTFDWGGTEEHIPGWFAVGRHPLQMATHQAAAAMFRRGDVAPARTLRTTISSLEQRLAAARQSGPWQGANTFGLPSGQALRQRVGDAPDGTTPVIEKCPDEPGHSDTGELLWERTDGLGVVTVNTPRSKAVIGTTRRGPYRLGEVTIAPAGNLQDWAAIALTNLVGEGFAAPGQSLLTACGYAENTAMGWTDDRQVSVGRDWGRAPALVEGIPATITLPLPAARVTVQALDERGQPKAAVPVRDEGGRATFTIGRDYGTVWYQIDIR